MAAIEITAEAFHPDDTDKQYPFMLGQRKRHRQVVAEALDDASHDSRGLEIDDPTTSSRDRVGIVPLEADLVSFKVYQTGSDDGSSKTTVDLQDKGGNSLLDSAVTLDGSGEATQSATISTTDLPQDEVLEIVVGGESDDSSPPTVFAEATFKYLDEKMHVQ